MRSPSNPEPGAHKRRFAENLRRIREERGLSQYALADLTDLHRTEVSLMERGMREPRLGTLVKLAGALEVPLEAFFEGIEWRSTERAPSSGGHYKIEPGEEQRGEG